MNSKSGEINNKDWKEWIEQTLIFSFLIPGLMIFAVSLAGGMTFQAAGAVALTSLATAAANLYGKYKKGETPLPVNQEVITTTSKIEPIIEKETIGKLESTSKQEIIEPTV